MFLFRRMRFCCSSTELFHDGAAAPLMVVHLNGLNNVALCAVRSPIFPMASRCHAVALPFLCMLYIDVRCKALVGVGGAFWSF